MAALEKAKLIKLSNDSKDTELETITVQFNPASLRLTLTNNTEGGAQKGRTAQQFTGNSATELSFDLVFDTADETGGGGEPRNVREKTAKVEQFVLPQGPAGKRQSPPRVKFEWGGLEIKGVISTVSLDFDLFAENGFPLRAKMSVSIKEQNADYQLMKSGPGSSKEGNAPSATGGIGFGMPGSLGLGLNLGLGVGLELGLSADFTLEAMAGESLADFAARVGVDPGAWRGLAAGVDGTLSLEAGVEIDVDTSLNLSAGVGVSTGFGADVGASLEASLGLERSGSLSAGAGAGATPAASSGFALSAAGGVGAAVETVRIARAEAAAGSAIRSFGAAGASATASVPSGGTSALASGAAASYVPTAPAAPSPYPEGATVISVEPESASAASTATPAAYAPPRADPRAVSYGFGVPLRPLVSGAAQARSGVVALRPYYSAAEVPVTRDPTIPPWEQLPAASTTRELPSGGPVRRKKVGGSTSGPGDFPAATGLTKSETRQRPRGARTGCGCGCGPGGKQR